MGRWPTRGSLLKSYLLPLAKTHFLLTPGIGITEINEELQLNLPEGEYQTVAGFLLAQLGYIPERGEIVDYGALRFIIRKMDGVRIEIVEVIR